MQRALDDEEAIPLSHVDLDITDEEAVTLVVNMNRPDVVINCAAWTDTAGCEKDPERARRANGEGPGFIASACAEVGATLVHISSNEVFDGDKGIAYLELDPVNPVNEYGRSKLLGEHTVAANLAEHQIVRTSWLYGPGRVSFPEKILERAKADGSLKVVTDEIATPTWTIDLAGAIGQLIKHKEYGIFHLANDGSCSRHEWAHAIVEECGLDVPVDETEQGALDMPFRKPVDSTLANTRAAELGIRMRPWREALADHLRETGAVPQGARR